MARRVINPQAPIMIPIGLFVEDESQPRQIFNDAEQQALNESVKLEGIHVPLEVRPSSVGPGQQWVIIKGTRRYRAAKNALLAEVPCVLAVAQTPRAIHSTQLLENSARADLDPLDKGQALFIEFLADQITAIQSEQHQTGDELDQIFTDNQTPTERIAALSLMLCRLSHMETVSAFLQSNTVQVPWKTVLARLGLSTLSERQRKQLLQPVRSIPLDVQDLLAGGNISGRTLSTLGDLDPEQQRHIVTEASQNDSDMGDALRNALDQHLTTGAAVLDDDQDDDDDHEAAATDLAAILNDPSSKRSSNDDGVQPFLRENGNAPRLITDQAAPARGSTPPPGYGTMSADGFLMFTGALEAVLGAFDHTDDAPLSEEQRRQASVLWNEILERGHAVGLEVNG